MAAKGAKAASKAAKAAPAEPAANAETQAETQAEQAAGAASASGTQAGEAAPNALALIAADTQSPDMVVCSSCHSEKAQSMCFKYKTVGSKSYWNCKACKDYQNNLKKALTELPPEVKEAWGKKGLATRNLLKEQLANEGYEALKKKLMHVCVHEETKKCNAQRTKTEGSFFDSPDLRERYKGKDDQLRNLKANALQFDDPIRGVRLYQDVTYSAKTSASASHETGTKRTMEGDEKEEPKEPKEKAPRPGADKALSDGQRVRLGKLREALGKDWKDLCANLDEARTKPNWQDDIPKKLHEKLAIVDCQVASAIAEIDLALAPSWMGKASAVTSSASAAKEDLQTIARRVHQCLEDAL